MSNWMVIIDTDRGRFAEVVSGLHSRHEALGVAADRLVRDGRLSADDFARAEYQVQGG